MEILKKVSSWYSGQPTQTESENKEEEDDICLSCSNPCDTHPSYPIYLAKKINQTNPLEGTVKPYSKHIVLCEGPGVESQWPKKIEKWDGSFAQAISQQIKELEELIPFKIMLTSSDEPTLGSTPSEELSSKKLQKDEDDESSSVPNLQDSCDILLFPDMLRFIKVKKDQIPALLKEIIDGKNSSGIISEPLKEKNVLLICAHKKRDKRCAISGPLLCQEFQKVLQEKGILEQTKILKTSHIGGHKYAGNVIIYPDGNWYGRLIPCHCQIIVEKHLGEGKILKKLWRGSITKDEKKTSW